MSSAESVLSEILCWMIRDPDAYQVLLLALSAHCLSSVADTRCTSDVHLRRRPDFIRVILQDFMNERLRFWDMDHDPDRNRTAIVAQHFTQSPFFRSL